MTEGRQLTEELTAGVNIPEKQLREIRDINRKKFDAIRSYGANLDPSSIAMLRIEALLSTILGPDERTEFEIKFEQFMTQALDDTLQQVRQAALINGVSPHNVMPLLGPDGRPTG